MTAQTFYRTVIQTSGDRAKRATGSADSAVGSRFRAATMRSGAA